MSTATPDTVETWARFEALIEVLPNGCWRWKAGLNSNGYGVCPWSPRPLAHRFAYQALIGPIPKGRELDHQCDHPWCANPHHCLPVTHRVNVLRGNSPPARQARQTHCTHGHEFTTANTYRNPKTGKRKCRRCHRDEEARRRGNQSS